MTKPKMAKIILIRISDKELISTTKYVQSVQEGSFAAKSLQFYKLIWAKNGH